MRNENERSAAFTRATGLPVDAFDGTNIYVHITTILGARDAAPEEKAPAQAEDRDWENWARQVAAERGAAKRAADQALDRLDEATYRLEERLEMINALACEIEDLDRDLVSMVAVRPDEEGPITYLVGSPESVEARISPHMTAGRVETIFSRLSIAEAVERVTNGPLPRFYG